MRVHGRAKVDARSPSAFAICDRCGFLYNHKDLRYQEIYAGQSTICTRILVCTQTCYDMPNPQLKVIIIPADPVPILDPRPEDYDTANA